MRTTNCANRQVLMFWWHLGDNTCPWFYQRLRKCGGSVLISATSRTQITLKKKIVEKAKEQKSMEIDFQQSTRNELIKTVWETFTQSPRKTPNKQAHFLLLDSTCKTTCKTQLELHSFLHELTRKFIKEELTFSIKSAHWFVYEKTEPNFLVHPINQNTSNLPIIWLLLHFINHIQIRKNTQIRKTHKNKQC